VKAWHNGPSIYFAAPGVDKLFTPNIKWSPKPFIYLVGCEAIAETDGIALVAAIELAVPNGTVKGFRGYGTPVDTIGLENSQYTIPGRVPRAHDNDDGFDTPGLSALGRRGVQ
jgi:hypothetical protein